VLNDYKNFTTKDGEFMKFIPLKTNPNSIKQILQNIISKDGFIKDISRIMLYM